MQNVEKRMALEHATVLQVSKAIHTTMTGDVVENVKLTVTVVPVWLASTLSAWTLAQELVVLWPNATSTTTSRLVCVLLDMLEIRSSNVDWPQLSHHQ